MKAKIKDGYLVIRIPLTDLPLPLEWEMVSAPRKAKKEPPKPLAHTEACLMQRRAEMLFTKQWPVHCRTCGAKGYIPGEGGQKRVCPRCLDFGICARCGTSALGKVSTEEGTFAICNQGENACGWSQAEAFSPAAEAAGLTAPVWRCNCEKENADA